jgi:hypothetical protein
MRKVILILILLTVPLQSQPILKAAWDYPDSEIGNIIRFEVKIDNGQYQSVGIPAQESFPTTLSGNHTYTYPVPFTTSGTHTFVVRACDNTECSFDVGVVFKWIGPPQNLRIVR